MDKFVVKWKRKNLEDDSIKQPFAKRRRISCEFGFRKPMLDYLKKNANPKVLLKLMQVSKYFLFKEFPFIVVKDLKHEDDKWNIDLENITKKLWITESFVIEENFSPFNDIMLVSSIVPKIAACDITDLWMIGQQISLQEFKLLNADKIKDFHFRESMITDSNGDILSVENILSFLLKVLSFS
uniref:Uncharacterized protein n=1 Tax=Panagrolaimus davidi TaxID=227884 RepID=A0A914QZ48_9BILA